MQPRAARTDICSNGTRAVAPPARQVRVAGCCGEDADAASFQQRAALGYRRRVLVRRVALAGSAACAVAALAVDLAGGMTASVLAGRLAWAASACAAGLIMGWARAAVTARRVDWRVDWRLAVAVAAVAAGAAWQPLVPGLLAVALLAERVVRPPDGREARAPGGRADRAPAPAAGRPG